MDNEFMAVVCPQGLSSGDVVLVTTPFGHEIEEVVPVGIGPGDGFEVFIGPGPAPAELALPKKHAKRLRELGEGEWAAGKRCRVCAAGAEPVPTGPWQDLSLDEAAAVMRAPESIALLGQGGTGKTFVANEQAKHLSCRV